MFKSFHFSPAHILAALKKQTSLVARWVYIALVGLTLRAAVTPTIASAQEKSITVTTSFSILQDLTQQIATPEFKVSTLVGQNQDLHLFQAKPSDLKQIQNSQLVILNGLGLDFWAEQILSRNKFHGKKIIATDGIKQILFTENHGKFQDPHAWQNPENIQNYLNQIENALASLSPQNAKKIHENRLNYQQQILGKHEQIKAKFSALPAAQRKIITTHDAFQYYGRIYGIQFLAAQGINAESEPSAKSLAALIKRIRSEKIKCLFLETTSNPTLLKQLQAETSAKIGGTLLADSLSAPAAKTYLEMMEHNFQQIYGCLSK